MKLSRLSGLDGLNGLKGPKETRAFVFYIVATLCMWEFGRSLEKVFTTTYFQLSSQGNPFASFVLTQNTGGAFSLLSQYTPLLSVFGIIALVVTAVYVYRNVILKDRLLIAACVLFSGGILGNLVQRLAQGYVVDYVKLNFVDFAVFNAFDVMICFAVVLFCYYIIFEEIFKKANGAKK